MLSLPLPSRPITVDHKHNHPLSVSLPLSSDHLSSPSSSSFHHPTTMADALLLPRDFADDDDDSDALSFCDLPFAALHHHPDGSCPAAVPPPPPASPLRDGPDFEFPAGPAISAVDAFLFCGKPIHYDLRECRVDSLLRRSDSFGRLQLLRSNSLRVARSRSSVAPAAASVGPSSSRRRHRALIGITKFPSRMELSDIRKRQGRRAPAPLFPTAVGGERVVADERSGGHWSLLRPLRCSSHLVNALAKASLGCIPHA